jgi:mRNA interferase HigB
VEVLNEQALRDAEKRYPDSRRQLREWVSTVEAAEWRHLLDLRQVYPHADGVQVRSGGTATVFNIGGNKYRLITMITYQLGHVYVVDLLAHSEYNKATWRDRL